MEEKKGALGQTETAEAAEGAEQAAQKGFTRRQVVIGGVGIGLAGLIAGGALAKWGVVEESIASGRIVLDPLPQKMIITDRARCSGCQRCELMCSLRNDGRACQHTARVRVWDNYNFGSGGESPDGMHRVPAELVPTYDNFLERMEELKAAQNDKQRIVSDISHDLKTPLTVIRGYAQAFEDGCVPPEKAGEYLRAMKEKTDEASQLIDSLFLYAKTNHPSYIPQLVRMDVCEAVRRIAVEMLPTIEQRACRLDAAIPDDPIWVRADGSLLARVLGNLINNACVHNPGGVTVRLTSKRTESEAVIAVADDGAGIPESIRDHVFEPFVTSNDARESGKGTGLGLSIAKRFIDLQGGTIAVSAQPEEDFETEIVVTLPLA